MAEQVVIPGSDYPAKMRSLWAVALLPLVTLGIYFFVWYYKINKEMVSLGRARGRSRELGDSPGKSLLAVTLGALVIVPAIVSLVHTFQRIQLTQRLTREGDVLNGWIALILFFVVSPALYAYMQSGLNESWQATRGRLAAPAAPAIPAVPPYSATPYAPPQPTDQTPNV
jgi:membrane protease YdiL (CAAX protease family)